MLSTDLLPTPDKCRMTKTHVGAFVTEIAFRAIKVHFPLGLQAIPEIPANLHRQLLLPVLSLFWINAETGIAVTQTFLRTSIHFPWPRESQEKQDQLYGCQVWEFFEQKVSRKGCEREDVEEIFAAC
jgi:hypothetical protein